MSGQPSYVALIRLTGSPPGPALAVFADRLAVFERRYRSAIGGVVRLARPVTVCTIYNGCSPDPEFQRRATTALTVFNDVILRVAFEHALAVIDLRLICTGAADYANPIEPSSRGGEKIARAIAGAVGAGLPAVREGARLA